MIFWSVIFFIFGGAASQYTGLSVCLSVCQFQLASGAVLLTILTFTIVGKYRTVFYNYPGPKNEDDRENEDNW